jgi:hypothetical protein
MAQQKKTEQELHPEQFFTTPEGHPRDRIVIHESMEIPKEGMFFALNGFSFLCKPGVEIDIPRPVRKMLDTRIRTETVQGDDGKDHKRNIPRITYTLIKEDVGKPVIPAPEVIASSNPNLPSDEPWDRKE